MKEKDDLIKIIESRVMKMMERQEDLFSSRAQSRLSYSLPNSGDWKGVTDRYAKENKQLKAHIARLTGKRQCVD